MTDSTYRFRFWLWLIRLIGVIVPRRLRSNWRQEWEAELFHREAMLEEWERLDWRTKLDLAWRSTSAFWDALWIQTYRWEGEFVQDVRFGIRMLRKRPAFTAIAVITLAVGVGANITIFDFVDSFFLRPIPARNLDRLVNIEARRNDEWNGYYSYQGYKWFRDNSKLFESMAAHYSTAPLNLEIYGDARIANGAVVSANYFPMLGIQPRLGRFFLPSEDTVPDRDPVVVISYRLWQDSFGGDPDVLGHDIKLNGKACRIIGVAPENFPGILAGFPNEFWLPTMMLHLGYRWCDVLAESDCNVLEIIGRLAPGTSRVAAEAELNLLSQQLAEIAPGERDRVISLRAPLGVRRNERETFAYQMQLLMVVSGTLLLVACANVTGLLLVRGASRRKEIAIRLCIGVGRGRLIRQFLTENLLLSFAGGTLGLLISRWARDVLAAFYNTASDVQYDLSLSPRSLIYAGGLTLLAGLLFGLIPAIQATRQDLTKTLKDDNNALGWRNHRLRSALVVGQVALSLALLVAAGLLMRSESYVRRGFNFDPQNVAALRLRPALLNYPPDKAQAFTREVVRRLEATPGVQSVTLARGAGLAWLSTGELRVRLPEQAGQRTEDQLLVSYHEIAPRFCQTLRIPLLAGREFDDRDRTGTARVALINETLARRLWPEASALDHTLIINETPYQVVGVSKDAQLYNVLESPQPFIYLPFWQNNLRAQIDSRLLVRTTGDPQAVIPRLLQGIASVNSEVPVAEVGTMSRQIDSRFRPVMLTSAVASCAGVLAFFLSMVGLYGVLAFSVGERTREIGIRMALGADRGEVLLMFISRGLRLTMIGVMVGLFAALASTRLVNSLLYGVSATDPITFAASAALLIGVGLVACWIPARRATRVDPLVALRHD